MNKQTNTKLLILIAILAVFFFAKWFIQFIPNYEKNIEICTAGTLKTENNSLFAVCHPNSREKCKNYYWCGDFEFSHLIQDNYCKTTEIDGEEIKSIIACYYKTKNNKW